MQDDPQRRKPDITRARTILGWEPKVKMIVFGFIPQHRITSAIIFFRRSSAWLNSDDCWNDRSQSFPLCMAAVLQLVHLSFFFQLASLPVRATEFGQLLCPSVVTQCWGRVLPKYSSSRDVASGLSRRNSGKRKPSATDKELSL